MNDAQAFERVRQKMSLVESEVKKVILGMDRAVHLSVIALFSRGHVLLEGVPGVGKTTLLRSLAAVVDGGFHRVDGSPDLMPDNVLYLLKFEDGKPVRDVRSWVKEGENLAILFINEINRIQPKTQAVFLSLMQERSVSAEEMDCRFSLPNVVVFADRNQLEKEETFELPHAQRDRFLMEIDVGYPDSDSEKAIIADPKFRDMNELVKSLRPTISVKEIRGVSEWIENNIKVSPRLVDYVYRIVDASRHPSRYGIVFSDIEGIDIEDAVVAGISPRGAGMIVRASQTAAAFRGSPVVEPADLHEIFIETVAHRVFFKPNYIRRRSNLASRVLDKIKAKVGPYEK